MAFFLNQLFGGLALILKDKDSDYYGFMHQIEEIISNNARVWGTMAFWAGLLKDLETFKPEIMMLDSYDFMRPERYSYGYLAIH